MNYTTDLAIGAMRAIALEVAQLQLTDVDAAEAKRLASESSMSEAEVKAFRNAIVDAAISLAA